MSCALEVIQTLRRSPLNSEKYDDANLCAEKSYPRTQQGCCGQANTAYSPEAVIEHIFTYHSPTPTTLPKFQAVREAGKYFAKVILQNVPYGQDRLTAILKVREAVMTANAGILLDGVQL
jgi:hypothetical protein